MYDSPTVHPHSHDVPLRPRTHVTLHLPLQIDREDAVFYHRPSAAVVKPREMFELTALVIPPLAPGAGAERTVRKEELVAHHSSA